MYFLLVDDEVSIYHQWTNQSQQTVEQTEVIQEAVSPKVSKLNHSVMKKKQGGQMQSFSRKKTVEKRKWTHHLSTHHAGRCVVL